MTTEITATDLIAALNTEGLTNVACEDTGGGCATLTIDGGIVQIGPGFFDGGAIFDTEELSFSLYEVNEDYSDEIAGSYVEFEENATATHIAKTVAAAYRAHKGA